MGLFGFGGKKRMQTDAQAMYQVASKISSTLAALMDQDPRMLASPYARVVLTNDWNIHVASDQRDPRQLLGPQDVSFVLLRENQAQLSNWVEQLKDGGFMAQVATEDYAKFLTRRLMEGVEIRG